MSVYDITVFGAAGDGRTDCTEPIRAAVAACAAAGGGTVYVPAGVYATGPIELAGGMTLYLESGATLRFTDRFDAYPPTFTRWSGYECYGYHPLIYGRGLERVAIKGEGVIDGRGQAWWENYRRLKHREKEAVSPFRERLIELNSALYAVLESTFAEWETQFLRPPLLQLVDCRYVTIEGVSLENSPFWNTHLVYCDGVKVRGVTFRNPPDTPNGDGLDLDSCTNVTVSDCQFDVGDDCLCLKSGINDDVALRNVTVEMTTDPEEKGGEPDMVKEELVMAGEGMYFKHVRNLELYRVRVETRQGPAVRLDRVEGAFLQGVDMRRRHPDAPIVEGGTVDA